MILLNLVPIIKINKIIETPTKEAHLVSLFNNINKTIKIREKIENNINLFFCKKPIKLNNLLLFINILENKIIIQTKIVITLADDAIKIKTLSGNK